MSLGKVLLGLFAGVAAGTLLGVLFAPDKGSVTRKKITEKSEDYAEVLTGKFNEFLDTLSKKSEDVKEEVVNVKSKAASAKKDVKSATT